MKERIAPIDGLRALAVLGVMWAHVWMFFGGVALKVGPVDIHRIISFGGIGVDLFFVISGFCMYLMHEKKSAHFSFSGYGDFLLKRWKRIAPAFYVIVVVECLVFFARQHIFPFESLFAHLFFVNTFINDSDNMLSPTFWSLATEWQFYILLPLLFIADPLKQHMVKRVLLLIAACLICRWFLFHHFADFLVRGITVQSDKIWYRFVEFGWGILAAKVYLDRRGIPKIFRGVGGFILAASIAYLGRIFMVTEVVNQLHQYAFLLRALGEPVMTFGFGLVILNIIESPTIFSRGLSAPFVRFVGRISYSMYLWHWIILNFVCHWIIRNAGISPLVMNATYFICLAIVIPVGWFSYRCFEAPYYQTHKPVVSAVV